MNLLQIDKTRPERILGRTREVAGLSPATATPENLAPGVLALRTAVC